MAAAIGMQSATVNRMNLSEVGTTYLTGTLTTLVSSLVTPGRADTVQAAAVRRAVRPGRGGGLSGLLIKTAAAAAPVLPLAALGVALVLAWAPAGWRGAVLAAAA